MLYKKIINQLFILKQFTSYYYLQLLLISIQSYINNHAHKLITQSTYIKQLTQIIVKQIKHLLTTQKPLCLSSNNASNICLNQQCQIKNPFICNNQQCKCIQNHQQCNQKRIDSFVRILNQQQKVISRIQDIINAQIDKIIDQISDKRDKLIQRIRNNNFLQISTQQNKQQNKQQQQQVIQIQKINDINSKVLSLCWDLNKKLQSQIDFNTIQNTLKSNSLSFNDHINNYFIQIDQKLKLYFQQPIKNKSINKSIQKQKIYWDPNYKSDSIQIQGNKLKKHKSQYGFALLAPSINKMNCNIVEWKIKINNSTGSWIGLGICLKQLIKTKQFKFQPINYQNAIHGSYIISSNKYVWCHQQKNKSHVNQGFNFTTGDIIQIQFNKITYELKFKKFNTEDEYNVVIDKKNIPTSDQLSICVQLLAPLKCKDNKRQRDYDF